MVVVRVQQLWAPFLSACCFLASTPLSCGVPAKLWQVQLDGAVLATPTLSPRGDVLVGSARLPRWFDGHNPRAGKFYSLSAQGTTNWVLDLIGAFFGSAPVAQDGTAYVGVRMNSGAYPLPMNKLYAIHPDGGIEWDLSIRFEMDSSPALSSDGNLYFTASSRLYSVSTRGTVNWILPSTTNGLRTFPELSPSIGPLHAIRPDGTFKWTFRTVRDFHSWPTFGNDGTIYVTCDDGRLYSLRPDGTERWSFQADSWGCDTPPVIGPDGTLYFAMLRTGYYAVTRDGEGKWHRPGQNGIPTWQAPAVSADGTLYYAIGDELMATDSDGTSTAIILRLDREWFSCARCSAETVCFT